MKWCVLIYSGEVRRTVYGPLLVPSDNYPDVVKALAKKLKVGQATISVWSTGRYARPQYNWGGAKSK